MASRNELPKGHCESIKFYSSLHLAFLCRIHQTNICLSAYSPLLSRSLQGPHQTRHTETRNYQHGHLVDYRTHQPRSQIANSSRLLSEDGQSREFYSSMRSLRLCCRSIWMEQARRGFTGGTAGFVFIAADLIPGIVNSIITFKLTLGCCLKYYELRKRFSNST
jgi:hypothetical protein